MERLIGDLTTLREFRTSDLEDYLAVVSDDRVTSWLSCDSRVKVTEIQLDAYAVRTGAPEISRLNSSIWPSQARPGRH